MISLALNGRTDGKSQRGLGRNPTSPTHSGVPASKPFVEWERMESAFCLSEYNSLKVRECLTVIPGRVSVRAREKSNAAMSESAHREGLRPFLVPSMAASLKSGQRASG